MDNPEKLETYIAYTKHKKKTNKAKTQHNMCWTSLFANKYNNANKTWAFLQTSGGKDEPNIVFMWKS